MFLVKGYSHFIQMVVLFFRPHGDELDRRHWVFQNWNAIREQKQRHNTVVFHAVFAGPYMGKEFRDETGCKSLHAHISYRLF